jgi:hypothetical protein
MPRGGGAVGAQKEAVTTSPSTSSGQPRRVRPTLVPDVDSRTPACEECGDVWFPADTDRWKLHLDVDDEPVWLCPECDEREFGGPMSV